MYIPKMKNYITKRYTVKKYASNTQLTQKNI